MSHITFNNVYFWREIATEQNILVIRFKWCSSRTDGQKTGRTYPETLAEKMKTPLFLNTWIDLSHSINWEIVSILDSDCKNTRISRSLALRQISHQ